VVRVSLHFFLIWYFLIELYLVLVVCLAMQYCTYSQLFLWIVDSDDDQESESRSPQHQVASRKRARLAQGCNAAVPRPGVEPVIFRS